MIIVFRTKRLLQDFLYQILQFADEKTEAQKSSEASKVTPANYSQN